MRGINALTNAMRLQAGVSRNIDSKPRLCLISSYDQGNHAVKVTRQPDGVESNWMPLGAIGIGNGWGVAVGPQIGDQVLVLFEEGDGDSGVIVARVFSTVDQAPAIPSGEIWAVHSSTSAVKLTNDGKVSVTSQSDCNITVGGTANVTATSNVNVNAKTAAITASTAATVTAPSITLGASGQSLLSFVTSAFMSLFNGHTHNEHDGGTTAAPNQQMTNAQLTTTVKGG